MLGFVTYTSENRPKSMSNKGFNETLNKNLCLFCGKTSHASTDCFSIIENTVSERIYMVKKKRLLFKMFEKRVTRR